MRSVINHTYDLTKIIKKQGANNAKQYNLPQNIIKV